MVINLFYNLRCYITWKYVNNCKEYQLCIYITNIFHRIVVNLHFIFIVVRFLRDTGSLIHVSDHTYQLTNLYFLNPSWLCDVLLEVVRFKHQNTSNIQDGMVLREELRKLCIESGFGDSRFEEYLQLLGRFEIALEAGENR